MIYSIVVYLYYRRRKRHVYIAGDFNVNTDPALRGDGNTQKFKNILSSIFLFPLIDKPTRVTRHSTTVIDNIYCNASDIATTCRSGILRLTISDHYAVFCINNSLEIANCFNDYFVSVGPDLFKDIVSTTNPMSYINNCSNSIVLPPVTLAEVRQTVMSMKNSSAGWDEFPALVAKQSIDSHIEPLTCLINRSFRDGVFSNELKLARVVPIFKCSDSRAPSNNRLISSLSFFSKIFEKLLYKCLLNFLDANDIIYKYQFGFRERHSTQLAIISLVEKITKSWESDDIVIGVCLDIKKAFDTVPHDNLIKKLHAYGICRNALKLLKSYLTNRTQYVIYDSVRSSTKPIQCGVPQGYILGPLLFIITLNDIFYTPFYMLMIPVHC